MRLWVNVRFLHIFCKASIIEHRVQSVMIAPIGLSRMHCIMLCVQKSEKKFIRRLTPELCERPIRRMRN